MSAVPYARGYALHQGTNSYAYSSDAGNYHEWEFRTVLEHKERKGIDTSKPFPKWRMVCEVTLLS